MKYYELYHALVQYPDIALDFIRHVKPPKGYELVNDVIKTLLDECMLCMDTVEDVIDLSEHKGFPMAMAMPEKFVELVYFCDTLYKREDIVSAIRKLNEVRA